MRKYGSELPEVPQFCHQYGSKIEIVNKIDKDLTPSKVEGKTQRIINKKIKNISIVKSL